VTPADTKRDSAGKGFFVKHSHLDLTSFCRIVDSCPAGITACNGDLHALYQYVGLPLGSSFTSQAVSKELYRKIKNAFVSGHQSVWRHCRKLKSELIQNHIIDGESLDPYFSVLDRLQDAVRAEGLPGDEIQGDWDEAIRDAYDHVRYQNLGMTGAVRERLNTRSFEVSKAAKRLQGAGYRVIRNSGDIYLEQESETRLVHEIERLIMTMGGLNIARRIFAMIAHNYDTSQERYHVVRRVSQTGGGTPQIPFGYLLLLAAKHVVGKKPLKNTDENWEQLLWLSANYAAVLDVQNYSAFAWVNIDAVALLPYLQELALYDTLFCIPQIRGSDIKKLVCGVLDGLDFDQRYGEGWSINEVLVVITSLLDMSYNHRGPICIEMRKIRKDCRTIAPEIVSTILDNVLSHPITGANQNFSKPTDAPMRGQTHPGHDFFLRPLLRYGSKTFFWLDRSMCASACLEALFQPLRACHKKFDDVQLGPAIERFLRKEFLLHEIPTLRGTYRVDGEEGECDLVVETTNMVIFIESKKKTLTRKARAGSDVNLILDLAKSILHAQIQAGWHEVRLRKYNLIELVDQGNKTKLELRGRNIERIAVSLLDFGSFQDRILLKQFLEGNLNAKFTVNDASFKKDFDELNDLLHELGQQVETLYQGKEKQVPPFHHCWFLSVPQLLVLLDGVRGEDAFEEALRRTRNVTFSSLDFYFELSHMNKLRARSTSALTGLLDSSNDLLLQF
jgi:Holliday junction resolvase-like predicted endonuclease